MKNKKLGLISAICIAIFILITVVVAVSMQKITQTTNQNLTPEQLRSQSYATLEEGNAYADDEKHVKFAAFFTEDNNYDGYAEMILGSCKEIGAKNTMFINVGVEEGGTLRNGIITINGDNFTYQMRMVKDSILKNNYVSNNVKSIELNNIQSGTQKIMMGDILAKITSPSSYSSNRNAITLTGTWVSEDGTQTQNIEKTIYLTVDWYGTASAKISAPYTEIDFGEAKSNSSNTVEFNFIVEETQKKLLIDENVVTLQIPTMFDEAPTSVRCKNNNVKAEYNPETRILEITKKTNTYVNTYSIEVTYSEQAYSKIYNGYTLSVPVSSYFNCSNNASEEFENPYRTNTAAAIKAIIFKEKVETPREAFEFSVSLMDKAYTTVPNVAYVMSKENILKAYDNPAEIENIKYKVLWSVIRTEKEASENLGVIMNEANNSESQYGDKWDSTVMSDYILNTGIFFRNTSYIPESGYIQLYDNDSNQMIKEFTYSEINSYNSELNCYSLDAGVKHVRIETNEKTPESGAQLQVYMVKELDVEAITKNFTKAQIENMSKLQTTLQGKLTNGSSISGYDECYLTEEKTYATVRVSKNEIETSNEEPVTQNITIEVPYNKTAYADWQNGTFLVELPSQISYFEVNNLQSNTEKVQIPAYEVYQKDGQYFIKIITTNAEPVSNYSIEIQSKMLANPTASSTSNAYIRLYYHNPEHETYFYTTKDIYDVNNNENTQELVGESTAVLSIVAPSSFVSVETISNYNYTDDVTIAPNIAKVLKGDNSAQINVSLINNYTSYAVENVVVVGKIPFEGNTYASGRDLNSKFTTTMNEGITIQNETTRNQLEGKVKIYYTTNPKPTQYKSDKQTIEEYIADTANGWILSDDVSDLSTVKAYLIVLQNNAIETGKTYEFSYKVSIPNDVTINETSYSCHSVSYDLVTDGGKLATSVEPNKVGLSVVEYYDLELSKYRKDTEVPVKGAIYQLTELNEPDEEDSENQIREINGARYIESSKKVSASASDGSISIEDLRINQVYSFKEISAPSEYELSNKEIIFKVTKKENGMLNYEKISTDDFDDDVEFGKKVKASRTVGTGNDGTTRIERDVLTSIVEDTPKFTLNITKQESENNTAIPGVIFEIYEKESTSSNNRKITNAEGKITVENLKINTPYIVKEAYVNGYYPLEDIEFTLTQNEAGNLSVASENTAFSTATIDKNENGSTIQMNVTLENDKIPTYTLKIVKVSENKENEQRLPGARFLITKTDVNKREYYTTNANGEIEITGLYAKELEKETNITGRYTLKEVEAPQGYINNSESINFVVSQNVDNKLSINVENDSNLKTVKETKVEENVVTVVIQDKPLFKITKTDEEGNPLANVDFIIYTLKDDGTINDYAKDVNGNYIGKRDESGRYIVTTNSNGEIIQALPGGDYKAVEATYPEGYEEKPYSETFRIAGKEEEEQPDFIKSFEITYDTAEDVHAVDDHAETTKELKIYTIEDLLDFSNAVNSGTTNYSDTKVLLMNDLDFNSDDPNDNSYRDANAVYKGESETGDWNSDETAENVKTEMTTGKGFPPIGSYTNSQYYVFSGIFDGQGHVIKNLYVNDSNNPYKGLFGVIQNASIKNLTVTGNVAGGYGSAGICANILNKVYIYNCVNKVNVTATWGLGGLMGYVQQRDGENLNVQIDSCENQGIVSGNNDIAGILGYIAGATEDSKLIIENTKNTNNINSSNSYSEGIGGILGYINFNNGNIVVKNSLNSGKIESSGSSAGGIVGNLGKAKLVITNTVNSGNIKGNSLCAGIIGNTRESDITSVEVSNFGNIDCTGDNNSGETGGIFGNIYGYVNDDEQNNVKLLKNVNKGNVTGKRYPGGLIGEISYGKLYIKESYNEKGITGTGYVGGLIGYLYNSQETLIEESYNKGDINHEGIYGGGLIGNEDYSNIQINKCYNEGSIIGENYSGGIVGYCSNRNNRSDVVIANTYNKGNVLGKDYSGGIIGYGIMNSNMPPKVYNCYNCGEIQGAVKIGGITGYSNAMTIQKSYNTGNLVIGSSNARVGGLAGEITVIEVDNCSNSGNISNEADGVMCVGGLIGYGGDGSISNSSNSGNIVIDKKASDNCYLGGIVGEVNASIQNCYNTGNIMKTGNNTSDSAFISGIRGNSSGNIECCYNIGKLSSYAVKSNIRGIGNGTIRNCYNAGDLEFDDSCTNAYGIGYGYNNSGYCYNIGNLINIDENNNWIVQPIGTSIGKSYYPDTLTISARDEDYETIQKNATSEEYMKSKEFADMLKEQSDKWIYVEGQYPELNIATLNGSDEVIELQIVNKKEQKQAKAYKINVTIESDINPETKGAFAGSFGYIDTTNTKYTTETVKQGESNKNSISFFIRGMTYRIKELKINDEPVIFENDEQRKSYNIPVGYFTNIDKDYNIVVSFEDVNDKGILNINKEDMEGNGLQGAKFEIESDYEMPNNSLLGEIQPNGSNYFIKDSRGYIVPSDANTPAYSYYKIDLTNETEDMQVLVNAYESYGGLFFGKITDNTNTINAEGPSADFLFASRTGRNLMYTSNVLKPGNVYYLHIGYFPGSNVNTQYEYLKYIKLIRYSEEIETEVENDGPNEFTKDGDKYIVNDFSNTGNSYALFPVDLTGKEGEYVVKFDALIKNEAYLYGYLETSNSTPSVTNWYESFLGTNGAAGYEREVEAYTQVFNGGRKYYIQLEYRAPSGQNAEIQVSNFKLYKTVNKQTYISGPNGKICNILQPGTYTVREVAAPDGYELDQKQEIVKINAKDNKTLTFKNIKLSPVTVHYYKKNTGEQFGNDPQKIKDDEQLYGLSGNAYNTSSKIETIINDYTLQKNNEGEYIIPGNASGTFTADPIDVYYYYEKTGTQAKDIIVKKKWQMPESEAANYRATVRLIAITTQNGHTIETPVTDVNGEIITKKIQGNEIVIFDNLPLYNGEEKIQYKAEEIMVEQTRSIDYESAQPIWEEVTGAFKAVYSTETEF